MSAVSCVGGQSRGIDLVVLSFGLRRRPRVSLMGLMVRVWLVVA